MLQRVRLYAFDLYKKVMLAQSQLLHRIYIQHRIQIVIWLVNIWYAIVYVCILCISVSGIQSR